MTRSEHVAALARSLNVNEDLLQHRLEEMRTAAEVWRNNGRSRADPAADEAFAVLSAMAYFWFEGLDDNGDGSGIRPDETEDRAGESVEARAEKRSRRLRRAKAVYLSLLPGDGRRRLSRILNDRTTPKRLEAMIRMEDAQGWFPEEDERPDPFEVAGALVDRTVRDILADPEVSPAERSALALIFERYRRGVSAAE